LNYSSHNRLVAGNFDRATHPRPNPTDFAHEIASDADIGWLHHIPSYLFVVYELRDHTVASK